MSGTVDYIFGRLQTTEFAMRKVVKDLKHQRNINRNIAIIAGISVYLAVVSGIELKKQAMQIKKLEKEIEGMRNPEGE